MTKVSKSSVNYRATTVDTGRRCATCVMFRPKTRSCTLVDGVIQPADVCDRWAPKRSKVGSGRS